MERQDQAVIQYAGDRDERYAAYRVFLDSVYANCGYPAPWKDISKEDRRTLTSFTCADWVAVWTEDEKKV